MAAYRSIRTDFWAHDAYADCSADARFLLVYLLTSGPPTAIMCRSVRQMANGMAPSGDMPDGRVSDALAAPRPSGPAVRFGCRSA